MHHSIRQFPSDQFYDGLIQDHESTVTRSMPASLKGLENIFKSRMLFFDLPSRESHDDKSKCNREEAEFTQRLVELIANNAGGFKNVKG